MKSLQILSLAGAILLCAASVHAQPKPKSQAEADAIMAIFNAQEPDARITAAENLLSKFADTEFKAVALQVAAASAQQKNDYEKMVIYSERTLEADPKNYPSMLMLSSGIAQRTREHDLDKEEKLTRAEKYANEAMPLIKEAAKPRPDLPDADWEAAKKDYLAQAHESLGLIAMVRKKYDVAATEFKTGVETGSTPDQATMVRLAAAYNMGGKPDDAIATLDKLMAMPDLNPQVKKVAEAERVNAIKRKGGGTPGAAGATPGTQPATPAQPTPTAQPTPQPPTSATPAPVSPSPSPTPTKP